MFRRKAHKALPEHYTLVLFLQGGPGIVRRILARAWGLFVTLLARPAPERGESLEAGDGQHPRRHRRAPFDPTSLAPHVEKPLADQVLRRGRIPNEPHYEPKHTNVVPRIQHLHG